MTETSPKGTSSGVVAKAGIYYTVCNFVFRGMAFLATPVFARLMSKAELGSFNSSALKAQPDS